MWLFSGKCRTNARVDGKTVVITGANTGIGKITAQELASRGARVIMACRDLTKAQIAADDIREALKNKENVGEVVVVHLNLSSFKSVRKCAEELLAKEPQINILINNAGVMACPRTLTEDGLETQFAVNHLAHFLFTCLLLPRIRSSAPSRIVNLSSLAHFGGKINFDDLNAEKSYSPSFNYAQSKLANILFTKELDKRLKESGNTQVTTYAVHPGVVATELSRHLSSAIVSGFTFLWDSIMKYFIKTPLQGAQTTLYCALDEEAGKESGLYYSDCHKTMPWRQARNKETASRLWEESVKMTNLGTFDPFTAPDITPLKQ